MTDLSDIQDKLHRFFKIRGDVDIHASGVVDVHGDIRLTSLLHALPVKFGVVTGSFSCYNTQLTTLKGAPHTVGGKFVADSNPLTSLKSAPTSVGGDCLVYSLDLVTLEGSPLTVGGSFNCNGNPLTSLQGAPQSVGGDFDCTYSQSLPLLRLFNHASIFVWEAPDQITQIIHKYQAQGKPGALKAAAELIRAGYKENARW